MNYLNNDYSLNHSLEQPMDSTDSEVEFLKVKLLETHSKLIKELQYSKDLQQELQKANKNVQLVQRDNEQLKRRLSSLSYKQDRTVSDKMKQFELTLVQAQKKNDLLRSDLETMRAKTVDLAAINKHLEQQNTEYEVSLTKLNERLNTLSKEVKLRDMNVEQYKQEAERYRIKYEKQASNNQEAQRQLEHLRRERTEFQKITENLQANLRLEREKHSKQFNEILMLQKENKDMKGKVEAAHEECTKLKDEVYQLKMRTISQERNMVSELQKLTLDYNNLHAMFKQKQMQLQSVKKKPLEDYSRKKHGYQQTKELVHKLQRQQHRKMMNRSSPSKDGLSPGRAKPVRTYKQQKQEYLTMIQSVGSMESQMLNCNLQKKKILGQIDKIDQTRVKTKEMIGRRRRLQVELQNQERKLDHIRNELKRRKVM